MKKSADQSRSIYCNFGTECDSCCIGRLAGRRVYEIEK